MLAKILKWALKLFLMLLVLPALYFWLNPCTVFPFRSGDYAAKPNISYTKIKVGGGPEDMAMDYSTGQARIIVSCAERRKERKEFGGFYIVNPTTKLSQEMIILPDNFEIHPHGIDIVEMNGAYYLYAISHHDNEGQPTDSIFVFQILGDSLILESDRTIYHPKIKVPNDLDVLSDGSFYASNFIPHNGPYETIKANLGMKTGSVVYCDASGQCDYAIKNLGLPNGVFVDEAQNLLYVMNGTCHEVIRYKINDGQVDESSKTSSKMYGEKVTIGDNLLMGTDGQLWTTAHPSPLDFLSHSKESNAFSPSQVFSIDPETLNVQKKFQNEGEIISAASTALYFDNRLFVSQVFEPFIIVIEEMN